MTTRNPHPFYHRRTPGCHWSSHIAEALRIPYEPVIQADSGSGPHSLRVTWSHKVQRRGAILEALFRISEGYFFGPHHLIMTSLLHFEEKVHQKKLQRADGIPLLFPRLLCQILEHLGYPEEPRLERRRHCERTSLSTNGITWPKDEILTDTTPPAPAASVHARGYTSYFPITQGAPPVMPATPAPPPSSEPTVTVSLTEFRGLVRSLQTLSTAQDSIIHQMATIRAHQDQIIATQAQHTTILHQIQQHLSMQTPLGMIGLHHPSL
ncbi:hypothetical protein CK203_066116 [Vitis vinifera]|uniref:Uncharacterized protein n=1 Tax=Vitis vinifera TaxID=29760 RepID=A0A438G4C3_VITVI|nr:hypothetical protein CK203_066116 [Vitis vinifera]